MGITLFSLTEVGLGIECGLRTTQLHIVFSRSGIRVTMEARLCS